MMINYINTNRHFSRFFLVCVFTLLSCFYCTSTCFAQTGDGKAAGVENDIVDSFPDVAILGKPFALHVWLNDHLAEHFDQFSSGSALREKPASAEALVLLDIENNAHSNTASISDYAIRTMLYLLWAVVLLILVYTARHYYFTFNRMFGKQRHPYIDIDTADWPSVTIFIAAHNEEAVIAHSLQALLEVDYPPEKLQIMPMNDRSKDRTKEIIDDFVLRFPGRITPFHRVDGKPGKAAALKDATALVNSEILIIFDADYVPGRGLIKQLVAPFFDPENGAVMGRVVPLNTGSNLLTRLLDMERSGGYQVDQQARMNLHLVPQYGGTVGGVRRAALDAVGGWRDEALAEDTDLTYRLLLDGWKTVYQNRSECYEEVPEGWGVRVRQIMRWSKGHNQAAIQYSVRLLGSKKVSWGEKLDGFLLLGVYAMSPILLFGWMLAITLFYFNPDNWLNGILALFALMSYSALGNFAAFFEIGAAVYLDGSRGRIKLMPLNYFGFLISLLAISRATFNQIVFDTLLKRTLVWDKTVRYRKPIVAHP
jgi:cellulose synthase/poly-beta-1,6-N-acetylglucosamine synthase-like glycosyltransferase